MVEGQETTEAAIPVPVDDDRGTAAAREPFRRCLATGESQLKERLIRFVVGPDDRIVPDLEGRLPGRGLWLSADRKTIERAVARQLFCRAARRPVKVDADLAARVGALAESRCLALVGLARRAGDAVAGFDQVRDALKSGKIGRGKRVALLLQAVDGAADGRAKLAALAGSLPVIEQFAAAALGAALGRERTVHAAIAAGGLADRIRLECRRFAGLVSPPVASGSLVPGADRIPCTNDELAEPT
ncbi:MAG: RNA-binding protein [Azospirillum sp.]|nr:RNA-binding protein [Azospirillum sp.]